MNCYFSACIPEPGVELTLDGSEYRHASAARRQRVGDEVCLINGEGRYGQGVVTSISRSVITLKISRASQLEPQRPGIVLASAVAKGDRQTFLLDMVTQLGIDEYVPLMCERSVSPGEERQRERWKRVCRAGCKQSHNPFVPHIAALATPHAFAERMQRAGIPVFVAQPGGTTALPYPKHGTVAVCVGPEGGFTTAEIAIFETVGARIVSLGLNILRIETAAVAAVCGIRHGRW